MKNLDELSLLFPEMEQKRQESTLGGDIYSGGGDGGGGFTWTGTNQLPVVPVYGNPTPPDPYPTPGFNTGGNTGGGGGYGSGDSGSGLVPGTPLHPEIVNHLMSTYRFNPDLINPTEKANFQKALQALDSSAAGDKVLIALDNYYKNNANIIPPTKMSMILERC